MSQIANRLVLRRNVHVEKRIEDLGLKMPAPAIPKGSFVNYAQVGNMIFLSGHLPQVPLNSLIPFFALITYFVFLSVIYLPFSFSQLRVLCLLAKLVKT
jgi:hypothetical protein